MDFVNNAIEYIVDPAINGLGILCTAKELAEEYLNDDRYASKPEMVNSMINWESSKNYSVGFVTALGGGVMLPAGVAGDLYVSWVIQARMSAAIAYIYGYDLNEDRTKTFILATILGEKLLKEVLKDFAIKFVTKGAKNLIMKGIKGATLRAINKAVGMRLVTKAGEKGLINLVKIVPVISGFVGGVIDVAYCRTVGSAAKLVFEKEN